MMALSTRCPIASLTLGVISPKISNSASSSTASGIGTMTASSAASMNTLSQACLVVCFMPVSPSTQYAVGRKSSTLIRVWLLVMFGSFRARDMKVDCFGASWKMVEITCSRIMASASALLVIFTFII